MRVAISNIAWDVAADAEVAAALQRNGIDAIDVVPGKYFPDPRAATASAIAGVRDWWRGRGIEITGMQALLFGTAGLNVFGSSESQVAMLERLSDVCRIGRGLGASRLVFGSARNRDRSALPDQEVREVAVGFFRRLADIARDHGVAICLEPIPARYGANFMTNSAETADVVSAVDRPAIRMQLDTGALTVNGEDPRRIVTEYGAMIGHVHASEPDLVPLGDGGADHATLGALLRDYLPEHVVSIEMLPAANEPGQAAIERALRVAIRHYGNRGAHGADVR